MSESLHRPLPGINISSRLSSICSETEAREVPVSVSESEAALGEEVGVEDLQ